MRLCVGAARTPARAPRCRSSWPPAVVLVRGDLDLQLLPHPRLEGVGAVGRERARRRRAEQPARRLQHKGRQRSIWNLSPVRCGPPRRAASVHTSVGIARWKVGPTSCTPGIMISSHHTPCHACDQSANGCGSAAAQRRHAPIVARIDEGQQRARQWHPCVPKPCQRSASTFGAVRTLRRRWRPMSPPPRRAGPGRGLRAPATHVRSKRGPQSARRPRAALLVREHRRAVAIALNCRRHRACPGDASSRARNTPS